MNKIISDNINKIRSVCEENNVKSLFAFGSVIEGRFTEKSDIDLLISFNPMKHEDYAENYFIVADKFEDIFHRPVDLITDKSLGNPYFINSLNKTKTLLYG